ncbi:MAG: hypothetical protein AAGF92_17685 [Myxococcota bacterium]
MTGWLDTIGAAYSVLLKSLGEEITIRAVDGSDTATLRGVYDRRAVPRDVNGTHGVDADYMIGVLEADLPAWVQPAIDSVGVELDVRSDALVVNEIHPDGQGVLVLLCRINVAT